MERTNDLGTIKISNNIFSNIILQAMNLVDGRAFLSSDQGKVLGGMDKRVSVGTLSSKITVEELENEYEISFNIIMEFGYSIKDTTDAILNYITDGIRKLKPDKPVIIKLRVNGVHAKRTAKRNLEFEARV